MKLSDLEQIAKLSYDRNCLIKLSDLTADQTILIKREKALRGPNSSVDIATSAYITLSEADAQAIRGIFSQQITNIEAQLKDLGVEL